MLKPAICTQCGANIKVDPSHDAGICQFCGTAFVTEKVINNYVSNHSTVHNVTENVTKIIYGNEKDEGSDHFKRGATLLKLAKYRDARRAFKKACDKSPEKAEYWFYYAASHTEVFTSLTRGFDTEEDESEYGLVPCFELLNAFFSLASDDDISRLGEEFGIDLSKKHEAVLTKIFENFTLKNDRADIMIFDIDNFAGAKPEYKALFKKPSVACALADLITRTKISGYATGGLITLYKLCKEALPEEKLNQLRPIIKDSVNQMNFNTLHINEVTLLDYEVDLVQGRYIVDAKSIMGIFALDTLSPITLVAHTDNADEFLKRIDTFLVK